MKKNKAKTVPITRPTLEPYSAYAPMFKESIESGMLTTNKFVAEFEKRTAAYLGVKHCVAVANCTSGLMLVMKGLGLTGEVIMPSFTFSASGHPALWNNLKPVFVDVDHKTYTLDPVQVEKAITPKTTAILATHVFGVVCDVEKLQALAGKHKLKLIFDAAHAFGSSRDGVLAGNFGDVEVFSCSPTKVLTTAEGGIVATNDAALAQFVRLGRNYGDDGNYNEAHAGLSARMSEFHAAIGLRSLKLLKPNLARRRSRSEYFKRKMLKLEPRFRFQEIPSGVMTTYKDLSLYIDPEVHGYTRDELHEFFKEKGIATRKYFYPPLHHHAAYGKFSKNLPITEELSSRVLSLPMYSHISQDEIDQTVAVCKEFLHDRNKA